MTDFETPPTFSDGSFYTLRQALPMHPEQAQAFVVNSLVRVTLVPRPLIAPSSGHQPPAWNRSLADTMYRLEIFVRELHQERIEIPYGNRSSWVPHDLFVEARTTTRPFREGAILTMNVNFPFDNNTKRLNRGTRVRVVTKPSGPVPGMRTEDIRSMRYCVASVPKYRISSYPMALHHMEIRLSPADAPEF